MILKGATFAIIASVAGYSIALGATYAALALDLQQRDYTPAAIAISAAMTPLGLLVSAVTLPRIARGSVYHWLLGGILSSSILLVIISLYSDYYFWLLLRFLLGCATNILFVVGESALMLSITGNKSGRILGLYNGIVTLGYALGPIILALTNASMKAALLLCGGVILIAVLPLFIARNDLRFSLPKMEVGEGLWLFILSAPALVAGSAATAIFDNATLSLFPVFAIESGLSQQTALVLLSVTLIGATMLQWPIGVCADHFSRLLILRVCTVVSAGMCLVMPLAVPSPILLGLIAFIAGGAAFGTYSAVLALVSERFKGTLLVAANATLGLMWGLGSVVGVPGVGVSMDQVSVGSFGPAVSIPFLLTLALTALPIVSKSKIYTQPATIKEGER